MYHTDVVHGAATPASVNSATSTEARGGDPDTSLPAYARSRSSSASSVSSAWNNTPSRKGDFVNVYLGVKVAREELSDPRMWGLSKRGLELAEEGIDPSRALVLARKEARRFTASPLDFGIAAAEHANPGLEGPQTRQGKTFRAVRVMARHAASDANETGLAPGQLGLLLKYRIKQSKIGRVGPGEFIVKGGLNARHLVDTTVLPPPPERKPGEFARAKEKTHRSDSCDIL